jgi:hypothetical protein
MVALQQGSAAALDERQREIVKPVKLGRSCMCPVKVGRSCMCPVKVGRRGIPTGFGRFRLVRVSQAFEPKRKILIGDRDAVSSIGRGPVGLTDWRIARAVGRDTNSQLRLRSLLAARDRTSLWR